MKLYRPSTRPLGPAMLSGHTRLTPNLNPTQRRESVCVCRERGCVCREREGVCVEREGVCVERERVCV